jgi:serine protease
MKTVACILLLFVACGHDAGGIDDTIGSTCASDRDCDSHCYLGGDFPSGFCSQSCVTDNDCPSDALCVSESGGVCMFACPPFDCSRLGPGWTCRDKDHAGGGTVNVCSGD